MVELDNINNINDVEENLYYRNWDPILKKGNIDLNSKKPNVVELFCWCGWTSKWFEMAWYDILLWCDIHSPSIQTFSKNHPNSSTILGNIKNVTSENIKKLIWNKKIDVLIAWVPCQGFSLNNRKRHENDKRNMLYMEYVRLIKWLKPKVILLENVSWMKSTWDFVKQIEIDLSNASNKIVTSKLLNASDYGVPQKRQRLIFIGVSENKEFDFSEIEKTCGPELWKPYINIKDAIWDLPSLKAWEQSDKYDKEPFSEYQKLMRWSLKTTDLTNHIAPNHPIDTINKIANTVPWKPMYDKYKQRIRLSREIQSPTQVAWWIRPQFQFWHPEDNRWLTIRERCRLQSFPDDFIVCGWIVQGRVQTWNAVPPLLAKAIALSIKKYL